MLPFYTNTALEGSLQCTHSLLSELAKPDSAIKKAVQEYIALHDSIRSATVTSPVASEVKKDQLRADQLGLDIMRFSAGTSPEADFSEGDGPARDSLTLLWDSLRLPQTERLWRWSARVPSQEACSDSAGPVWWQGSSATLDEDARKFGELRRTGAALTEQIAKYNNPS